MQLLKIKQAVFRQGIQAVNQLMQEFEANYDEKIVKVVTHEVDFYIGAEKYNKLYREQFN